MVARASGLNARAALALAEALPHPACVCDGSGRLAWANAAFALLAGQRREELPGAELASVLPSALAAHLVQRGAEVLASGAPDERDESWDLDGVHLLVSVRRFALPGAPGGAPLVGCIATDQTRERLARLQLHALEVRCRAAGLTPR